MSAWMPIESAPKDGTHFLGRNEEFGVRETHMKHYQKGSLGYAIWERGDGPRNCGWDWYEPIHNWSGSWEPTHWMPLPESPQ